MPPRDGSITRSQPAPARAQVTISRHASVSDRGGSRVREMKPFVIQPSPMEKSRVSRDRSRQRGSREISEKFGAFKNGIPADNVAAGAGVSAGRGEITDSVRG